MVYTENYPVLDETEWKDYCQLPGIHSKETPSDWMKRIWDRLMDYKNRGRLAGSMKRFIIANKMKYLWEGDLDHAVGVNITICYSCNKLVYSNIRCKYGICHFMDKHWSTNCTGNAYCDISFRDYIEFKNKLKSGLINSFDEKQAIRRYELWMQNAIRRVKRAREIGRKIRAVKVIQEKWLEYFYRPDGLCASELALHYQLLWTVRKEMRQINNFLDSICIMKFNKAYSGLINKLPPSLVNKAWKRLLSRKKSPMTEEEASTINPIVELFLRHEISIDMVNQESQTQDTVPICEHEEEISCRVKKKLDNCSGSCLSLQLLEFNEKTFDPFIQEIAKQLEEQVNANNKLRSEIDQQKLKLQKAEKLLAIPIYSSNFRGESQPRRTLKGSSTALVKSNTKNLDLANVYQ
ncbi:hypothetical protein Glove_307g54 [Diversispora epigaea]|uniref:Uncharacterized protein n=1 Tax=Diversispora epigaea TaxID=1348612 RepID=A0A397HZ24_9GLOM|nr:hypothetical protein Glove_307g54 [Diversispora epigaea]